MMQVGSTVTENRIFEPMVGPDQKPTFFPAHAEDLARSGISVDFALSHGLRSLGTEALARELGFSVPAQTTGLLIPYGSDHFRVRLFPALGTMKYAQPKKTGVRLYIPESVQGHLKNHAVAFMVVEGEKKTLAAVQAGFPCIGIGGIWSWVRDGKAVNDFDAITWIEREVTIVPDSDVLARPDLMRAVFALGKELEGRGARVKVVLIPQPGEEKIGLDDYLVVHGAEAFNKLSTVALKHPGFSAARAWYKEWKDKGSARPLSQSATDLLEQIQTTRSIHPAQDFEGGVLSFGILAGEEILLVNSKREIVKASELPDGLTICDGGFDCSRFSKDAVARFLAGATQRGTELAAEIRGFFERFLVLRDQRIFLLLTLWTMGTYIYRAFRVFPYISLRSPTRECGKSRTQDLVGILAFNSSQREVSPTEAFLFRGPAKNGGTVLLDELEGLKHDRDRFGNLLSVLCSGFEGGGSVSRIEKRGEKFMEVSYPTYCPRMLAGINRLSDTLEGRSLTVFLERKLRAERVERFSRTRLFDDMQGSRDRLYTWALCRAADIAEIYHAIDRFRALEGLGDRERDLWEPLTSVALAIDAEGEGRPLTDELLALAHDLSKIRGEVDTAKVHEVLDILTEAMGNATEWRVTPAELLKRFKADCRFEWLRTTKGLAGLLAPLGLTSKTLRFPDGKRSRGYEITMEILADLRHRYGGESDEE